MDTAEPVLDGLISLREAIVAANTNAPYGDAPAGDSTEADVITANGHVGGAAIFGGTFEIDGSVDDTRQFHLRYNSGLSGTVLRGNNNSEKGVKIGGVLYAKDTTRRTQREGHNAKDTTIKIRGTHVHGSIHADNGRGAGMFLDSSEIEIDNSRLGSSVEGGQLTGGAVYATNGTTLAISNAEFWSNRAKVGGGIYAGPDTQTDLNNVDFRVHYATIGGAIANFGTLTISNSDFSDSYANGDPDLLDGLGDATESVFRTVRNDVAV